MKIFKILLILALGLQVGLFGAEGESGSNQTNQEESPFSKDDLYVKSGSCSWQCREVKDGYVTKISGYDIVSGETQCVVFKQGTEIPLDYNANQTNDACSLSKNMKDNIVDKVIDIKSNGIGTDGRNIKYNYDGKNKNIITLSELFVGIVTLNPDIIDRYSTSKKGELTLSKNKEMYGITHIYSEKSQKLKALDYSVFDLPSIISKGIDVGKNLYDGNVATARLKAMPLSSQTTSAIDGFNKNNMAYFNDLFASNEEVYQHLQVFIFILVGGFFVMTIGASKIQVYLENRGESEGKQPYLHKFYMPLLMVGVFFMPIPEGNGYHSTVMQNMIRYFAQYSTQIADMANAVGAKVYVDKIYKSVGGYSTETLAALTMEDEKQRYTIEQIDKVLIPRCYVRYPDLRNADISNEGGNTKVKNFNVNFDPNQVSGSKNDVYADTCINLIIQRNNALQKKAITESMKTSNKNFESTYKDKLKQIDDYFVIRNRQLGWIDSIVLPTASIYVETIMFKDALDEAGDSYAKMEKELKANQKNIELSNHNGDWKSQERASKKEIKQSLTGMLGGRLVWMMMPGATALKDFILESYGLIQGAINSAILFFSAKTGTFAISAPITLILNIVASLAKVPISYYFTTVLMEWTFNMIPLLAICTACLVAYISYLVSLCKYFYISPFVTAWAMATKRTDKIIDFLLTGIAIFFRPILIVLFTFLALFFYIFIEDFFIFISIEQFSGISIPINKTNILESWIVNQQQHGILSGTYNFVKEIGSISLNAAENFHINFIIGAISGLLKIFGGLASSYIAWKLIVNGPTWALGLIGLDGKQDDAIAQGIENNLARRAFVA